MGVRIMRLNDRRYMRTGPSSRLQEKTLFDPETNKRPEKVAFT